MKVNQTNITFAPNNEWTPTFEKIPGVNAQPIDYNLLKNKP